MRQRTLVYIIAVNLILTVFFGATAAFFADFGIASMSLGAGRIEMRLCELAEDGPTPLMNVTVVNEGTISSDLWLENIYCRQPEDAEFELNDLSGLNADGDTGGVTIEVAYQSEATSFVINDLERHGLPLLLLRGIEPGGEALVTISQNAGPGPDVLQESPAEVALSDGYYEQLSASVPYIFEFILKSNTFTSLAGESVITLTRFFEVYHPSAKLEDPAAATANSVPAVGAEPEEAAATPEETPAVPEETPAVPEETPAVPEDTPAVPEDTPVVPEDTAVVPSKPDLSGPEEGLPEQSGFTLIS